MNPARYLVDTSALIRLLRNDGVQAHWQQHLAAGLLTICPLTELEFLYTARSAVHRSHLVEQLTTAFTWTPMPERVFSRAAQVQSTLTQVGPHRSAGPVDLLVAATAELQGLTMLHYDRDFDQVATITGQAAAWVAPAGSVD